MKNLNISTKKIDGVVLRYAESGDYNKIFTILTSENKKISLFAPNVKRAKKGQGAPEVGSGPARCRLPDILCLHQRGRPGRAVHRSAAALMVAQGASPGL